MISPRSNSTSFAQWNSIVAILFFASSSYAFSVLPSSSTSITSITSITSTSTSYSAAAISTSTTSLNMFGDAFKGAFGNDESLGKAKNAGLSNVSIRGNQTIVIQGTVIRAEEIIGRRCYKYQRKSNNRNTGISF